MNPSAFVQQLVELSEREGGGRAELAALRRGATGEERDFVRIYRLVLPNAPSSPAPQQAYLEVACLFGLHPTTAEQVPRAQTLARALRIMADKSDSIEARFIALLQCHREELFLHLRSCVALARSNDIPLQWVDVLFALLRWDDPTAQDSSRPSPQRRWAQEFWGSLPSDADEETRPASEGARAP